MQAVLCVVEVEVLPELVCTVKHYFQNPIENLKIMGLFLDFLGSVLPGPEEASPPIQQK
jgi:hypothetical protein